METERKLGCIPSVIQAKRALECGKKSDEQRIAELSAPWDATDQPSIIQWNEDWKSYPESKYSPLSSGCQREP